MLVLKHEHKHNEYITPRSPQKLCEGTYQESKLLKPSDYVRSLIREDQRRLAATNLLDDMVAKHLAANPATPAAKLDKLRGEFWSRWMELKTDIDAGLASLDLDGGTILNDDILTNVKSRGRARLAKARAV